MNVSTQKKGTGSERLCPYNSVTPSKLKLEIEGFEDKEVFDVELNLIMPNKPNGYATNY